MKHWNAEIEQLTKSNYAPDVVQGIKDLEALLDENPALASVMDDVVFRYVVTETLPMTDALTEIKDIAKQFGQNE